jgi:hypothetical protein
VQKVVGRILDYYLPQFSLPPHFFSFILLSFRHFLPIPSEVTQIFPSKMHKIQKSSININTTNINISANALLWIAFFLVAIIFLLFCHLASSNNSLGCCSIFLQNSNGNNGKKAVEEVENSFWDSKEFDVSEWEENNELFPGEVEGTKSKFILPSFAKGQCGGLGNQVNKYQ